MSRPLLGNFDWILINTSAGKDSQAMTDEVVRMARQAGVEDRVVLVHADLGRAEWSGTKELAQEHADHYGRPLVVVRRTQDESLIAYAKRRGMWPSPRMRWCTSDFKRGPVNKYIGELTKQWWASNLSPKRPVRILNCMGMRAEESPARAKLEPVKHRTGQWNSRRQVTDWLPIHGWTVNQVWERNRAAGTRHHRAYDIGMPRLSCCFCIFAPKRALMLAGKHNPELLAEYVAVEKEIGHTFKADLSLAQVQEELNAGADPGPVTDWRM